MVDAPWYEIDENIYEDIEIKAGKDIIQTWVCSLTQISNILIFFLLMRICQFDLINILDAILLVSSKFA